MKVVIEFTSKEKESVLSVLRKRCRVNPTEEQLVEFFAKYPGLAGDIKEAGSAEDTFEREFVMQRFAQYLLGEDSDWPCLGDDQKDKDKFFKNYVLAAKEKGIELLDEVA